jgi:nucleotide-binding universal stress UspA family protein
LLHVRACRAIEGAEMNYRSIFLHLDSSPVCAGRIDFAINLALAHESYLTAIAACGWPVPSTVVATDLLGFGPLIPPSDESRQAAQGVCERFADRARERGLTSFSARVEEVAGGQVLVQQARCHDLAVLGQPERDGGDPVVPGDLAIQVLMGSGRPLLVVPWAGRFNAPPKTAVVAWSGSRESARAVADALPLLTRAKAVHLLGFDRTRAEGAGTQSGLAAVQQWLGHHRIQAQLHHETEDIEFGEALLSRVSDLGADLIVMGGYGHSRATEFVLGGMTRTILSSMTAPVLLSH